MRRLRWRAALVGGVLAFSVVCLLPTFSEVPQGLRRLLPAPGLRLGLDLRGGMHLLMGVELDRALTASLDRASMELADRLDQEDLVVDRIERQGDRLVVMLAGPEDRSQVEELLRREFPELELKQAEGAKLILCLRPSERHRLENMSVDQAVEVIRNRVDQFGVSEPSIQRVGRDRILVQLPGLHDPERAKAIIGRTAQLEFRLVDEGASPANPPPEDEVLWDQEGNPYVVQRRTLLTGNMLADARVRIDPQFNQPYVFLRFNRRGAGIFDRITAHNVGKRLAIILDRKVYSAPVIRERIPGGRAQITGRFTLEEARDLAIVLRAGALPAPVRVLEERTVGPSLGHDSIVQGLQAILVGGAAVVTFMIAYYRLGGLIASLALLANLIIVLGSLSVFHAALTLPGIAGLLLTIGMAVDANVLVYERVREELRAGRTPMAALEAGFSRALLTILDANITTLIAAAVLFHFGTGPIRGFALTLSLGILATLFTVLIGCRLAFDWWLMKFRPAELSV